MMSMQDSEYHGPRYVYGLTYRPASDFNVPAGWLEGSERKDGRFRFGTVDYPRRLLDIEEIGFELTFVGRKG